MTLARVAVIGVLVVAVGVGIVLFGGGGTTHYTLIFQNASQLVNDDDVQVGGRGSGRHEHRADRPQPGRGRHRPGGRLHPLHRGRAPWCA